MHLDVDREPRAAAELGVSAIPALRMLTPDGGLVASLEGALPADELIAWLVEQRGTSALDFTPEISAAGARRPLRC